MSLHVTVVLDWIKAELNIFNSYLQIIFLLVDYHYDSKEAGHYWVLVITTHSEMEVQGLSSLVISYCSYFFTDSLFLYIYWCAAR